MAKQDKGKQDKGNMFGSFGQAVAEREQEQKRIEAEVTGRTAPEPAGGKSVTAGKPAARPRAAATGRPRKRVAPTCMTISISQADKDLVKDYAFAHAVTVSDLIHTWINENCTE